MPEELMAEEKSIWPIAYNMSQKNRTFFVRAISH